MSDIYCILQQLVGKSKLLTKIHEAGYTAQRKVIYEAMANAR